MKVKVNQDKCFGCGACPSLVPEVFDFNDDGFACAKEEVIEDKNIQEKVTEAANNCPAGAIEVEK